MKKIILIILSLFIFSSNVYASGLSFSFELKDNVLSLVVIEDKKVVSYEYAEEKYNLNRFTKFKYDGRDVYFNYGVECSKNDYIIGAAGEEADNRANFEDNSYRVTNTEEFINAVKDIYNKKKYGKYKLVYSKYEYNDFDIEAIKEFYQNNLLTPLDKNMYKFNEYGINYPIRYIPAIDEDETIINYNNLVISDNEYKLLEEFKDYFVKLFVGKDDMYKIYNVFNFIKNNSKFVSDNSYEYLIDAYISPYDVLFEHKMVCIGASTTFQYLMEALGIESYIVDEVVGVDPNNNLFVTEHTYNVVKLNDSWYVIDIVEDKFLTKDNGNNYSLDIIISSEDAIIPGGIQELDSSYILNKIDEIKNKKQVDKEIDVSKDEIKGDKEEQKETSDSSDIKNDNHKVLVYTIAIIILTVIGFIIFFVTI